MKDHSKSGLLLRWKRRVAVMLLLSATWILWPATAQAAFKSTLQGQEPGNTNWLNGPLNGWGELAFVPVRILFTAGPSSNLVLTVSFEHTKGGTIPGIQYLVGFSNSPNVIITSPPVLSSPVGVDTWSYTFTVTVINNQDGAVFFSARLAAGSHSFPGAALHITLGNGQLQINKPAVVLGNPDMALTKTGPTQAQTNQIITYVINWTNKLIAAQTARGVQVSDILPAQVSYVPGSASKGGTILGNMIIWDLNNLAPGKRGILTYKVLVTNNIPVTTTFANFAQIQCSQDDANPADNTFSVNTTVVVVVPVVANDDVYAIGKNTTLNVSAPGVLLNDSNALSATLLTAPVNGTLTFNANGSFNYTPDPGFLGSDIFAYQGLNGTNVSGPAVVTVNVTNTCFLVSAPNFTTNNSPGQCGALVNFPPPVTTGDCDTIICTPTNGSFFPVGATAVTCTNTDGINASFTVTVLDAEPPVLICPTNMVLTANGGQCSRSNVTFVVSATDNCSVTNLVSVPASGSTFPVGVTTVTNTATDNSGNTSTCTFTVTVNDTQAPTLTCPADVTVSVDVGSCSATGVALGSPTTSDNCGAVTVTNDATAQLPVGTNLVTWTATDNSGNTATCVQRVSVRDTEPPVITCPANMVLTADPGQCSRGNVTFSVTATDLCGTVTFIGSVPASGSNFPVGVTTVTNAAIDNSGNTSVCTFTVTVNDAQSPAITCPADVTVDADVGACVATGVVLGSPTTADNCGAVTVTNNAPAQYPVGTNLVTWTVTDNSGNTSTCQQHVIVRDTQPPVITCPSNIVAAADPGECSKSNVTFLVTATDNCGAVSVVSIPPSGSTFPVGATMVTNIATDASGNQTVCTFSVGVPGVTVNDTQPPVITCPSDLVLTADPGQCSRSNVTFLVTATDNCSVTNLVSVPPSGSTFPVGVTTVTNVATDEAGNQAACTFTVTVNDTEPPVIVCPSNLVVTADPGQCGGTNVTFVVSATDNCGVTNLVTVPPSGSAFPVGVTTVTNFATDSSGNTSTCTFTVTVQDLEAPTITCPGNIVVVADPGQCSKSNVTFSVTASDNCSGVTVVSIPPSGSTFPLGTTIVTNIATDASGNQSVCTFTVGASSTSLSDTQPPVISCPSDLVLTADPGQCSRTNVTFLVTATDNCSVTNLLSVPASGSTFPVGVTTVTNIATDAAGSQAACSFTVTILDPEPPVISCPTNMVLATDAGLCSRSNVTFVVSATDNCTVTNLVSVPPSGSSFPLGMTTVTNTATDISGNFSTCTFTVTVQDAQAPTLTCPPDVTVDPNAGVCIATGVVLGTPAASDNCGAVTVTSNAPAIFLPGTNLVTWTATDGGGNTTTCEQLVLVRDTQPPTITCPAEVTVNANPGVCFATGVALGTPTASDNCSLVTVTSNAPAQYSIGTNFVTWTATDSSGNTATCIQTVIVTDNQPPVITTCPAQVTVAANAGTCAATNVNLGNLVASDNCSGALTITNDAPASFPLGTNSVTWTVTDSSGNAATCVQTVVVTDDQPPVITTCPAQVNVVADAGTCAATNVTLGTLVASDNCGGTLTVTNDAPASFPVGTNLVTWTVSDAGGNTATCVQTVVVTDTQPPVITTCPALVNVVADAGTCAATNVNLGNLAASDNCGGAVTVTNDAPASFPVGTNTVTWTVTDTHGNTATCVQTVVVTDAQPPVITTCPAQVNVVVNDGACNATNVALGTLVASDNCGGPVTITNDAPANFPVGTNTVTWTVTDTHGNTATCLQTVVVTDAQPPVITTCPALVTVVADAGTCAATNVNLGNLVASDNCGGALTVVNNAPASFPVGTNLVTWTVSDAGGNTATCVQTVVVTDTQPPTITTCPAQVNVVVNDGACNATNVALGTLVASDNCGGAVTFTNDAPANFPVGTNTVTWTATDSSGNTATCLQTVVVTDTQPPVITTCPAQVNVVADAGTCAATNVNLGNLAATDNCGGALTVVNNAPASFPVGTNTVTWTVSDAGGNTATCVQTVVVTDTQPPVITTCPALVTVVADAGTCAATNVNLGNLVASDNCGGALTVSNDAPVSFPVGTNTVTWTVRDATGNTATCVQTVVVTDSQPPTITTCPTQVNVVVNDGACNATNVALGTLVASDNCGGALSITNDAPANFPVGTNMVTWTVTDIHGNTATCLQTVVVTDTQPPVITTCPAQVTVVADAGTCAATNVNLGNLVATDNCGGALTVVNNAPASFPVGTNTVTWTVSDAGGNTATCVQTVVVTDTQPPTITTCPAQVNVVADAGTCAATNVNLGNLVATDNCGGAVTVTNDAPANFPVGTNTVTWTVTDTHGNTATCVQTVVVTDAQPPVITTCPAQVNVVVNDGACNATNVALGTLVAGDNCGGAVTITNDAPASFPVGTNTVTWTVTDTHGNTATCLQTVVVTDTQPPVITTCPALVNVVADAGTCAATNVNLGNLVATDNCGGALTIVNNAPTSFPVGTNLVTWTVSDAGGNTATCVQTVVVTDTRPPTITTCPAQVNVVVNDGACNATNVALGTPVASDNCGGAVTFTNDAPASFPVGTNTVTWTAKDSSGNTATCLQTVVVTDTQPPVITTCPAQVNVVADAGTCAATNVNLGNLVASDNCGGALTVTNDAPASFPVGTNTVTWTVRDAGGNTATCVQTVVVTDTQPPVITTCPAQVNVVADAGTCAATNVNLGNLVASDNCGGALTVVNNAPASFPVGTNTVTWTVTDTHGNTATCLQAVVVSDSQPPTITTCPALVNVVVNDGACNATNVALGTLAATDNCGGALTITNDAPANFPVGTNTVTWTVTDTHGNTATCLQTVVVTDTQPPAITTCPGLVTVVADAGTCAATNVILGNLVATDNCGGALTIVNNAPASFPIGTNTVTWTVSDAGGNTATCLQTVVVTDVQPPVITTCPALVNVVADAGTCAATNVNLGNLVATDNCGGAVTITNDAPANFPVGTNLVTWTVSDAGGNTTTCVQTVVVTDAQPPTITTCPAQVTVAANPGTCAATNVNLGNLVASDNCGGVMTVTNDAPASFPLGSNTVTWTVRDASGNTATCVQTVVVTDTQPPTITCPPNVTVTAAPGLSTTNVTFTVTATDNCSVTNLVSVPPSGSAFAVGVTTVTNTATDCSGNTSQCTFTVRVLPGAMPPQFGVLAGTNVFNPQTGLFEQNVTVSNQGDTTLAAVRLLVDGLRTNVYLYNASGTNGGRPYVQCNAPLDPGHSVQFVLEFHDGDRRPFTNTLEAQAVLPDASGNNGFAGVAIRREFLDVRTADSPRFVIEFATIPGRTYTILYSDDNMLTWKAATPSLTANSTSTQWYDDGPPKTSSKPLSISSRLYRVLVAPANP